MRQLSAAQLVQDFARLGVAVVVTRHGLVLGQHLKSTGGEFRIDDHRLQRNDQRVAPKQRHEPWQAGGWYEHHVTCAMPGKPQSGHVLHALIITTIKLLVTSVDF